MSQGWGDGRDSRPHQHPADGGPGEAAARAPEHGAREHGASEHGATEGGVPEGDVHAWYHRGLDLLRSGNPAAAAQLLERAAAAEPASRSIREALARAQFDSGRYAAAADSFGWIVDSSPSDDYARFGLGLSLARAGDPEAAAGHLALAVAMCPHVRHYTTALRGVRATLRSRGITRDGGAE